MLDKWRLGIRDKRGCLEVLLTKLILMLLKLSILFGAVLILLCGAAQSGVSMLCTVVQGVSTVLLSQEILSDIRKAMMPDSKVRSLFGLSISFGGHYYLLENEKLHLEAKCNALCLKYFDRIKEKEDLEQLLGEKDTTNNNFESIRECELKCVLSNDLYMYMLLAIGLIVLAVCVLLWLFVRTSNSLTTLQRSESTRENKNVDKDEEPAITFHKQKASFSRRIFQHGTPNSPRSLNEIQHKEEEE